MKSENRPGILIVMDKPFLTKEQQKLLIDNYPLVRDFIEKTLEKNQIPSDLEDDFISDMLWKFCMSALNFKSSKGFKFSTYAYGGFHFGLKNILRVAINKRKLSSIEEEIEEPHKAIIEEEVLKDFLDNSNLSDKEKKIINDRYINKFTYVQLSEKHNMSKESSRLIVHRILKKLKMSAKDKKLKIEDFYI